MYKILIDDKIPFIRGVFEPFADVEYLNGSDINAGNLRDADALIVRTRTHCNEKLLANSQIKYIATATIGFDHIDTDFCRKRGISWTNAPGCNAASVQQYIASALFFLQKNQKINLSKSTIGVVGVGNVGKLVVEFCKNIGMHVLQNDPPRQIAETSPLPCGEGLGEGSEFVDLNEIAENCDIITFHTPLNTGTFHLANKAFFEKLKKKPLIINTARGEIIDTEVIKNARKENLISGIVLDCWENEPQIDTELLSMCDIATPHIAGYSADGKANATTACVRYISRCLGLGLDDWSVSEIPQPAEPVYHCELRSVSEVELRSVSEVELQKAILHSYNIEEDSLKLKNNPNDFEFFRNYYPLRREFPAFFVEGENTELRLLSVVELLQKIGFRHTK